MARAVHALESRRIDMRIDLRRGDAGVPQQFLDFPQVGASSKHVCGETVTERVGADPLRQSGSPCILSDDFPNRLATQSPSTLGQQKPRRRRTSFGSQTASLPVQVFGNRLPGGSAERKDPLFAPFAFAEAVAFLQVHITDFQMGHFGSSATCCIQQLQEGAISERKRISRPRGSQKSIDQPRRNDFRNLFPKRLTAEQFGRIVLDSAVQLQEAVVHPERRDMTGDRSGRQRP